jgi:hypothetical protein
MILRALALTACSFALLAQQPAPKPKPINYLKAVLQLTDQQVQTLQQLRLDRIAELQQLKQIQQTGEKRRALRELLRQETPPQPANVGDLILAIKADGQRVKQVQARYVEASRNVLSEEQQKKLRSLRRVLRLGPAARQAVSWKLIRPAKRKR